VGLVPDGRKIRRIAEDVEPSQIARALAVLEYVFRRRDEDIRTETVSAALGFLEQRC